MKFLLKSLIIVLFFSGFYLCSYTNIFSEYVYRLTFYSENVKEYMDHIVLQNKNINNQTTNTNTSDLMNEYFISIFNTNHLNYELKDILISSNFNILNLKNQIFDDNIKNSISFLNDKNIVAINQNLSKPIPENMAFDENIYRLFKYDNYLISYFKPTLLNNKDLTILNNHLNVVENNSYTPIIFINNSNLNEKLLKFILNKNRVVITIGDQFSIKETKSLPIINLGSFNDIDFLCQLNLFLSDFSLSKLRIKLFPTNKDGSIIRDEKLLEILNNFNNNSKIKFQISENADYIYVEYGILKDS